MVWSRGTQLRHLEATNGASDDGHKGCGLLLLQQQVLHHCSVAADASAAWLPSSDSSS